MMKYLMLGKQPNTFSLVENRKMRSIYFVSPIDISHNNKTIQATGN